AVAQQCGAAAPDPWLVIHCEIPSTSGTRPVHTTGPTVPRGTRGGRPHRCAGLEQGEAVQSRASEEWRVRGEGERREIGSMLLTLHSSAKVAPPPSGPNEVPSCRRRRNRRRWGQDGPVRRGADERTRPLTSRRTRNPAARLDPTDNPSRPPRDILRPSPHCKTLPAIA